MTQIFIPLKPDVVEKSTFEVNSGTIDFGDGVELLSTGKIQLATSVAKAIGIIDNMAAYRAAEGTAYVSAGDMALVAKFGITYNGKSGGTFSKGAYLEISSGKIINSASATALIAIDASTASGQMAKYLVK